MAAVFIVLGIVFLALGLAGVAFRTRLDDANMKHTPRWMKPADGGGVFSANQRSYRLKTQTVSMVILALLGAGLLIAGLVNL